MRWLGVKCWKRHPAVLGAVTLKPGTKIIVLWQGAGWCVGSVRRFYAPGSRGANAGWNIELLYSDGQSADHALSLHRYRIGPKVPNPHRQERQIGWKRPRLHRCLSVSRPKPCHRIQRDDSPPIQTSQCLACCKAHSGVCTCTPPRSIGEAIAQSIAKGNPRQIGSTFQLDAVYIQTSYFATIPVVLFAV
mmetsp:Transcript_67508/g.100108  ORF Transcript_67508/g.100108 Transcript_67508/m.100108 type:complete len:190 (+) Transcript_67508:385-954(+)